MNDSTLELIGALIGLSRVTNGTVSEKDVSRQLVIDALCAVHNGKDEDKYTKKIRSRKLDMAPQCACCSHPCTSNMDYSVEQFKNNKPEIQQIKMQLIQQLSDIAANISISDHDAIAYLYKALFSMGMSLNAQALRKLLLEGQAYIN